MYQFEDAFLKERNSRLALNERKKQLQRDVRVLTLEKLEALNRASAAETEARKVKEDLRELQERFQQLQNFTNAGPHRPSSGSSHNSLGSRQTAEQNQPRDPLTCVWPRNNTRFIMPPNGTPSTLQGSRQPGVGNDEISAGGSGQGPEGEGGQEVRMLQWDADCKKTKQNKKKKEEEKEKMMEEKDKKKKEEKEKKEKEKEVRITSSLDSDLFNELERVDKSKNVERWPCQACTYKNRANRWTCDFCGTVDAVQRKLLT